MILKPVSDIFSQSEEFLAFKMAQAERAGGGSDAILIEGISPSSFPLVSASIFNEFPGQTVIITENYQKMYDMHMDIASFVDPGFLFLFPPWETLPYEFLSPPEKTERDRISTLYRLIKGEPALVVTTVESLIRKIPDRDFYFKKGVALEQGGEYPFGDIIEMLAAYGYSREKRVDSFGQFSVKGGIIDIFLPSNESPLRLDFFGDSLESIREFDIYSQISNASFDSVTIFPRKELILFEEERVKLFEILSEAYKRGMDLPENILQQLKHGSITEATGIEDLFPLVIKATTLLSYLAEDARILFVEPGELTVRKNHILNRYIVLFNRIDNFIGFHF